MRIVFYVSGHGFGHATRDAELMRTMGAVDPGVRFVVRTMVPAWLFARCPHVAAVQPLETDTGLVQIDSLRFDERETAVQAARFYDTFDRRVTDEAAVLRSLDADLVIGDIPPLAFAAAERAAVPSIALGNFTWDWIYSAYDVFDTLAPTVVPVIQRAYGSLHLALRLPFHGGFEPMAGRVRDIPLIARRSRRDRRETRRLLGVLGNTPVVLTSFGGYGVALPDARQFAGTAFTVLDIGQPVPHGLAYEDIVAAADVVISKPGYGIVSECIANGTALLYTSRGRLREYDRFVEEMPRVLRCRHLTQEALHAGDWGDAIEALLAQPAPAESPATDGADVAAAAVFDVRR
ncbi:MAG: hypothetical protein ABUS56_00540 [Acidobacteriota bacterium]